LEGAQFFDPAPMPNKPGYYGYGDPIILPCPVELISINGIICHGDEEDIQLHLHCNFADQEGKGYSGHFIEGNHVLSTVEVVIGEIEGIKMHRGMDAERGVPVFRPIQS